ncbi:DUF3293 domain-containing protein [Solimonas soli]|uniref:DUF3293 domain-containing protein n=1 Tax=Solimonas soli TaxID=413479 RepID=UPI0004ADD23C|nr:DUF3293 domain-containing protein [Solimonas soli]
MTRDTALAAAFADARYDCELGGQRWTRRVGAIDAAADAALRAAGCRAHWHIVTPCNPGAQRRPAAHNAARLAAFVHELDAAGWRHVPSLNRGDDAQWDEAGRCVFDAPEAAIAALARRYGQRALLRGALGAAPQLVWLGA